jgi:hypothetical protein
MTGRSLQAALGALALVFVLSGCGAIIHGTRQAITATSTPDSATVTTNPPSGSTVTPATLHLERRHTYVLTFEKAGYSSATVEIQNRLSGGIVFLDVVLTGLVGVVVDATTGGWYHLSPATAVAGLNKVATVAGPDRIDIVISVRRKSGTREVQVAADAAGVLIRVRPKPGE